MDAHYLASFATNRAKTLRLKIGRAKPGVTTDEAKAALAGMVEANVLDPEAGRLTEAKSLQYVVTTRTPFDLA